MGDLIVRVVTLGCKVNQCESASIVAALNKLNHTASEGLAPADVYILNTCSVTAEADRKSRQYIAKMRKQNPDCKIIVLGCSSQNNTKQFEKDNVIAIGGTKNKERFVLKAMDNLRYSILINRILYDKNIENIGKNDTYCPENVPKFSKTRAFIKIQDGCDRFCSYCIIPYLRGRSRSKPIDDIVKECVACESKEIVLNGIDISYYGRDIGSSMTELIKALSDIPARKRLGSIECEMIDDDLLIAMRDGNFCPHFHLSLQSGSDEVLRTMNRRYDTAFYMEKVKQIRKYFDLASITTDIIVGFPTETNKLFVESLKFIEKCEFSDIHIFPYSSRKGTLASKKYVTLPPSVVSEREAMLLDIKACTHRAFLEKNLNTVASVYTEESHDSCYNVGHTPNYIKVYSTSPCDEIKDLRLTKLFNDGILGE